MGEEDAPVICIVVGIILSLYIKISIYMYVSDFQWVQLHRLPKQTPQHPVWERGWQPAVRPHSKTADVADRCSFIPVGLAHCSKPPAWCVLFVQVNATACAIPRTVIAILETHQTKVRRQHRTHFTCVASQKAAILSCRLPIIESSWIWQNRLKSLEEHTFSAF